MNKQKAIVGGAVILIVAVGAAWAMGFFRGVDPAVAKLQQLRDQMRDASDAERQQLREQFRTRMGSLTDQQREALRRDGRGGWQRFAAERMDEFFTLPPEQQRQRLDEIIDQMARRQNDRPRNPEGRNRGGGRNMTDAQRDARRKQMLARTDPKMRAQFSEFRRMLDNRLQERGMPPMQGRGPGRGGAFRGTS